MRIIKIKNLQDSSDIYCGITIGSGEYYQLQSIGERDEFVNSTKVSQHLWSDPAKIAINDGESDLSSAAGDKWLKEGCENRRIYLEDKNNPGEFDPGTHDSNKYFNVHVRKDYSTVKHAEITTKTTTNLWIPADGKHVDITDIQLGGRITESGKYLKVVVQIYQNSAWIPIFCAQGYGIGPIAGMMPICGHLDTDSGDGEVARVRVVTSGDVADDNFEICIHIHGHEEG